MTEVYILLPSTSEFSATLGVPVREVDELERLGLTLLVVLLFLGLFLGSDLLVLRLGESSGDVRVVSELTNLDVLLGAGSVGVATRRLRECEKDYLHRKAISIFVILFGWIY